MHELPQFLPNLLLIYLAYTVATISPSPANLAIMTTAMSRGRKTGVTFAFGVITGSLTWAFLALSGLTELLKVYSITLIYIKIAGGLYLLWMALRAFRSALSSSMPSANIHVDQDTFYKTYFQGLALHLTNPKAAFAWLAIISLGVQETTPFWFIIAIFIGCLFLGVMIFIGYALIFSSPIMIAKYAKIRRPLEALMSMVFGFAGLRLLTYEI